MHEDVGLQLQQGKHRLAVHGSPARPCDSLTMNAQSMNQGAGADEDKVGEEAANNVGAADGAGNDAQEVQDE